MTSLSECTTCSGFWHFRKDVKPKGIARYHFTKSEWENFENPEKVSKFYMAWRAGYALLCGCILAISVHKHIPEWENYLIVPTTWSLVIQVTYALLFLILHLGLFLLGCCPKCNKVKPQYPHEMEQEPAEEGVGVGVGVTTETKEKEKTPKEKESLSTTTLSKKVNVNASEGVEGEKKSVTGSASVINDPEGKPMSTPSRISKPGAVPQPQPQPQPPPVQRQSHHHHIHIHGHHTPEGVHLDPTAEYSLMTFDITQLRSEWSRVNINCLESTIWILFSVVSTLSIVITVGFWAGRLNEGISEWTGKKMNKLDYEDALTHGVNLFLAFVDFMIVAIPVRFTHFVYFFTLILVYGMCREVHEAVNSSVKSAPLDHWYERLVLGLTLYFFVGLGVSCIFQALLWLVYVFRLNIVSRFSCREDKFCVTEYHTYKYPKYRSSLEYLEDESTSVSIDDEEFLKKYHIHTPHEQRSRSLTKSVKTPAPQSQ